ncbi:MAG: hypothetical protein GY801_49410, partial [bacterium]|nr:hypothetical protein [bacterium]
KTIFVVEHDEKNVLWEPFSCRFPGIYRLQRNLYKNISGNAVIFEEINHDLNLTFRYAWRTSDRYGFVRTAWLSNAGETPCRVEMLDGIQNVLPYGVTSQIQTTMSNLLDAYKRNELEPSGEIGMFTLSSILTDLAEPSEALQATTVWHSGLEPTRYLLSSQQLDRFRQGFELAQENDVRGKRGAFLVNARLQIQAHSEQEWHIVADIKQEYSDIVNVRNALVQNRQELTASVLRDIEKGTEHLTDIIACADGLQISDDRLSTAHHVSNGLFNTMRGGIFAEGYSLSKTDLADFVQTRNPGVLKAQSGFFEALPAEIALNDLVRRAAGTDSEDIERLCYEYLPLTFSRRHGDPSRPWNKFSINLKHADGSQKLDYQGNWRDIFQNWEPLAYSYPEFVESMICKFLNATTIDGYNPYRVTRDGIEWEVPEPENPWSNIGYWSDHQIIYLQKLLEVSRKFHPGKLNRMLGRRIFSHANVPYKIKPYTSLLQDCYETIEFDRTLNRNIETLVEEKGTDGKLLLDNSGNVLHVNLAEKLLILLLAKLSNFVPEGGIWMNTQRPEWNDANNALVGKGLSMVTVYYLRRFMVFLCDLFNAHESAELRVSQEVKTWFNAIRLTFETYQHPLHTSLTDADRRAMMDELGEAGSVYRQQYYQHGLSGDVTAISRDTLVASLETALRYIEHTIRANKREDGLYHAYNILHPGEQTASVGHLYEMLEGQVAVLSSGLLSAKEALEVLKSLRSGKMYREDQHSYMLYPDRTLPGFLAKNCLHAEQLNDSKLFASLVEYSDSTIITKDEDGVYHFNGNFRNAKDVNAALNRLKTQEQYAELVEKESETILELFEEVFDHSSFTGRSGTFFAYEGLGSIYWHMVSKLLLAVQENVFLAVAHDEDEAIIRKLAEKYYDIRSGLGFHKTPDVYGAFPTDPYSHTPAGQGAKQPGMTGQVKEEILTRLGEMGLFVDDGKITFHPVLLRKEEFLKHPQVFSYTDVAGQPKTLELPAGSLAYSFCQTPVVYCSDASAKISVSFTDGSTREIEGNSLDAELSRRLFQRDGHIRQVTVYTAAGR